MSLIRFGSRLQRDNDRSDPSDKRLAMALSHIRKEGDLHALPLPRSEKCAIARNANQRHLIIWNRRKQRYCLTGGGDAFVARHSQDGRVAVSQSCGAESLSILQGT
jgi:hypothetical protein